MPATDAQIENRSRNVAREFTIQSKNPPLYVNIHDGRRVPNVQNMRKHVDYRPFYGDPAMSDTDALATLSQAGHQRVGVRVTASRPIIDIETFDLSSAKRDEMLAFAADEYPDLELDPKAHPMTIRKLIMAAAERAKAAAEKPEDLS